MKSGSDTFFEQRFGREPAESAIRNERVGRKEREGIRDYASSPDLTKDETPGHALDYKGNSISLSLVN